MSKAIRSKNGVTPPRKAAIGPTSRTEFSHDHWVTAEFNKNFGLFEVPEYTKVPTSVKFVGSGGTVKRIECYTGSGCFTKYKNPEGIAGHGPAHGRKASVVPFPGANVMTMWASFTLKGTNVFGDNGVIDHIPIFLRSNPTNMNLPGYELVDGLGLALYKRNNGLWNPNLHCVSSTSWACYSGIRLETCAQSLRRGDLGALPAMTGSKTDGASPAQYLLDGVKYKVIIHATTTGVATQIVAPSLGSSFYYYSPRPAEYGNFQWLNTGYVIAMICQGGSSCDNFANQNFSLEVSSINMGWFIP